MIGKTILHYIILEELGRGGMGVVYKARDTKLKRDVAIKFLPRQIAASDEERERFKIEAQAAAALNHPNIATIYAIEEADDQLFIVMEYIEGKELRQMVGATGPVAPAAAIEIAIQIAEGLQAAHAKGVVHRDIKSANIMVTDKGQVKVMDFGLAKIHGGAQVTKVGTTLGTAAYMSPEQARGEEVDARSDIWSFGVVLYEMLAGELPFKGEYEQAVTYAIINEKPQPLAELRADMPLFLQHIATKCLAKDPAQRYASLDELLQDFRLKPAPQHTALPPESRAESRAAETESKKSKPFFLIGIASLLIIAIVLLAIVLLQQPNPQLALEKVITRITSSPGLEDEPTWSPDGKFIAYTSNAAGNMDILIKPLGGGALIPLAESDADDGQPAWSLDGSKIAFVSARDQESYFSIALGIGPVQNYVIGKGGDIFLIPAFGGTAEKLIDNAYYPSWSPDGENIVFQSPRNGYMDLWRIPAGGGAPVQLTNDADFDYHPRWSPDGQWIAYCSGINPIYNLKVIPAYGGKPRLLTDDPHMVLRPAWSPDGKYIIFSSNRSGSINLWKIPFSGLDDGGPARLQQITVGQGADQNVSISHDGTRIAYSTISVNSDIWEFSPTEKTYRQITSETSAEDLPSLSPDGKTLLITSDRSGPLGLWTIDLSSKQVRQLSNPDAQTWMGAWSPDGKQIAYVQTNESGNYIYVRSPGSLSPRRIAFNQDMLEYPSWSPDGQKISFYQQTGDGVNNWVFDLTSGETKQITYSEDDAGFATWSPNSKFLTFQTQKGSVRHLWIVSARGGTPRQLTFGNEEHSHPQWSPTNADEILFLLNHKNLCTVSVATGKIKQLTDYRESDLILDYPSWSPDGKKVYYSISRKQGDIYTLENY